MQGCHFGAPANMIMVQYVLSNNSGQYIQTSHPKQKEKSFKRLCKIKVNKICDSPKMPVFWEMIIEYPQPLIGYPSFFALLSLPTIL